MSPIELLVTFAELSVSYIGFASIVAAIQSVGRRKWSLSDRLVFRVLIEISVVSVFLSLIPVTLSSTGMAATAIWVISSAIALVASVSAAIFRRYQNRRLLGHQPKVGMFVAAPLALSAAILSLLNLTIWRSATAYVSVMLIVIAIASALFLALVFRFFPLVDGGSLDAEVEDTRG